MDDAQVLAGDTARYEAFRVLLPKVLEDLRACVDMRDVKLGYETRVAIAAAAADATARLVVGGSNEATS
jgi:hypothetical protein